MTKLPPELEKLLFTYQRNHTVRVIDILKANNAVLDASDTGTGKTYAAIATMRYLGWQPIVICPKSIIGTWQRIADEFGVTPITVTNYESLRSGKCYRRGKSGVTKKQNCDFINTAKVKHHYEVSWDLTKYPKACFIFDEVHRCRHFGTMNSQMLLAAKESGKPVMMLTATIADSPENFRLFTYMLNFIDPAQVDLEKIDFEQYMNIIDRWLIRDPKPMVKIHGFLYPDRASRIRVADLGKLFPETQITANSYTLSSKRTAEIEREYQILANQLDQLRDKSVKDKKSNPLTATLRAHQRIELLKIPIFIELANDSLANGYSVVIFVNFTQTLKTICRMLHTETVIYGQQSGEERNKHIDDFQSNRQRVIVCNIAAGGVGISLHDLDGGYPRVALISPSWSSTHLVQALGRVHRAGGKSKSLQRIIYTANTVEESIAEKVRRKLRDLNSINNGDLDLTNIKFIREKKRFMKLF